MWIYLDFPGFTWIYLSEENDFIVGGNNLLVRGNDILIGGKCRSVKRFKNQLAKQLGWIEMIY